MQQNHLSNDTIVALATPHGTGAIAVVRLSGKDALPICDTVFYTRDGAPKMISDKASLVLVVGFAHDAAMTAACYRDGVRQFYQSPRPDREGHGGESETSVALHSFPGLVKREIIGEFLLHKPGRYHVDTKYTDLLGFNATSCWNSIFRRF